MVRFHAALFPQRLCGKYSKGEKDMSETLQGTVKWFSAQKGYALSPVKTGLIISPTFRRSRWMDTGN